MESFGFGARHGLPMYGTMAMHIYGFRENLVQPPYEFQAKRLLVRLDNIRGRIDQDDPRWFDEQAAAMLTFQLTGEFPKDELHLEALLVDIELDQLRAHKKGKDVAKMMAALDQVARAEDEELEAALQQVCEMAKEGRIR